MPLRFCLECKNFEDRVEIDGVALCAKGHNPRISCPEFQDRFEGMRVTISRTHFCLECKNFEDRVEIDGVALCAKGHNPRISCPEFQDRVTDIFYAYIYRAYLYSIGETDEGKKYFEERFSRKLSPQELAYILLAEYFNLNLDYLDFCRCWGIVSRIYRQKIPSISEILDAALERFNKHGERTDLKKAFLDIIYSVKTPREVAEAISSGLYRG